MTTITINRDYIEVKGHSGYAPVGKDIVCAAISTLIEATYRYLKVMDSKVTETIGEGYYKIDYPELNSEGYKLIDEFIVMIEDLESQYPANIKVEGECIL